MPDEILIETIIGRTGSPGGGGRDAAHSLKFFRWIDFKSISTYCGKMSRAYGEFKNNEEKEKVKQYLILCAEFFIREKAIWEPENTYQITWVYQPPFGDSPARLGVKITIAESAAYSLQESIADFHEFLKKNEI